MSKSHAALGFRVHSGWAALVVLAGPLDSPAVMDRRRIEIADSKIAGSKQPFHAAEKLELSEAEKLVSTCTQRSEQLAREAVRLAIADAERKGYPIATSSVLQGSGKPIPTLEKILASHPLLHTAEGELFRNVVVSACVGCGLTVVGVKEKELATRALQQLGISQTGIEGHLVRMGKMIGAPWRQDEKFASLAAWIALAAVAEQLAT